MIYGTCKMLLLYVLLMFWRTTLTLNDMHVEKVSVPDVIALRHYPSKCSNCKEWQTQEGTQQRILTAVKSLTNILMTEPKKNHSGEYGTNSPSLNKVLISGPKVVILNETGKATMFPSSESLLRMLVTDALKQSEAEVTKECRNQFQWDKWNCNISSIPLLTDEDKVTTTRETSFLQALTSAALAYVMSKQCAIGYYNVCACDVLPKPDEWWRGCVDNHEVGYRASKILLDTFITGKEKDRFMHHRNSHVGRMVYKRNLVVACKCLGPTGSCSVKVCFRTLPSFRVISKTLKRKYRDARKMTTLRKQQQNRDGSGEQNAFASKTLLYMDDSPDYCKQNVTLNIQGTLGRKCYKSKKYKNVSRAQKNSCRTLCTDCGYDIGVKKEMVNYKCDCKFYWCCEVRCDICQIAEDAHYCVS